MDKDVAECLKNLFEAGRLTAESILLLTDIVKAQSHRLAATERRCDALRDQIDRDNGRL